MPTPKTWAEELVFEWTHLNGYACEANVPLLPQKRGGRREADIIAYRVVKKNSKPKLEILHIEVGMLLHSKKKNVNIIKRKFDLGIIKFIVEYVKSKLCNLPLKEYRGTYIALSESKVNEIKDDLSNYNNYLSKNLQYPITLEAFSLKDLLTKRIPKDIDNWKEKQSKLRGTKAKPKFFMLPESWWLLKMMEYLISNELLKNDD